MFTPESYTIASSLLARLLGFIYFFAFGAFLFQIKGLIGSNGILPVSRYLYNMQIYLKNRRRLVLFPTLFWFKSTDTALMFIVSLGTILSVFLFLGFIPFIILPLLYILYLSIHTVGQDFLSFGWEGFLLEITANAFLLSLTTVPNAMVWVSINFLLFRFHFHAGLVKFQSRDPNWRNYCALSYHYQTQPIPSTLAWYMHRLPLWFHKLSCVIMFAIELVIPFGIFLGDDLRFLTFVAFFGLQFFIWFSGNYSYLNYLTVVLSVILISNGIYEMIGIHPPSTKETPVALDVAITLCGAILFAFQFVRFWHQCFPRPQFETILRTIAPYYLANRYGIFAVMTTKRYEIVVEGSEDGVTWKEYTFKYKPSEVTRRPRRIAPYQPRLDWQAWFLPFSTYGEEPWFQSFLYHILKGTPEVLYLLRGNPFPDHPPTFVRAVIYDYIFSSSEEKKSKGWWWHRTFVGHYSPTLKLK